MLVFDLLLVVAISVVSTVHAQGNVSYYDVKGKYGLCYEGDTTYIRECVHKSNFFMYMLSHTPKIDETGATCSNMGFEFVSYDNMFPQARLFWRGGASAYAAYEEAFWLNHTNGKEYLKISRDHNQACTPKPRKPSAPRYSPPPVSQETDIVAMYDSSGVFPECAEGTRMYITACVQQSDYFSYANSLSPVIVNGSCSAIPGFQQLLKDPVFTNMTVYWQGDAASGASFLAKYLLTHPDLPGYLATSKAINPACGGSLGRALRQPTVVHVPPGVGTLEQAIADNVEPNTIFALGSGEYGLLQPLNLVHRVNVTFTSQIPHPATPTAEAMVNAQPVISGAYRVPASLWARNGTGNVWTAALPPGSWSPTHGVPRQMFVSSVTVAVSRRVRARHPNLYESTGVNVEQFPYLFWKSTLEDMSNTALPHCAGGKDCAAIGCNATKCEFANNRNRYGFRYNDSVDGGLWEALANDLHNGRAADMESVVYHGWTQSRHYITDIDPAGHAVTFTNPADRPIGFWTGRQSEGGQRYYVENNPRLLDAVGEWYLESTDDGGGLLMYIPFDREITDDGQSLNISAWLPRMNELAVIDGAHNVTFSSVTFSFCDWTCGGVNRTTPCDRQSTDFQTNAAIRVHNSSYVQFDGVRLTHLGPQALWVQGGSKAVTFTNGEMSDLGTGGLRVGSQLVPHGGSIPGHLPINTTTAISHVHFTDNVLTDGGWVFASGTPVFVEAGVENVLIEHNEISYFSYTAISLGWSWSYAPQPATGFHTVRKNHIHHLGFPRRDLGDAMACVYTLGQLNGTVVDSNLCHDVRAYMSGGYCLSQDQGSSSITFTNNVCLRVTGSPHNTHYGVNLTYSNNIFWGGYYDSWVAGNVSSAGALRTSPTTTKPCGSVDFPTACPDQLYMNHNIIGQINNRSARLFEGNFNETSSAVAGALRFTFSQNFYWSDIPDMDLSTAAVFGGESARMHRGSDNQLSWEQWRQQHGGTQDSGSVLGKTHPFANDDWATSFNVTLDPVSPALHIGITNINISDVGPRN